MTATTTSTMISIDLNDNFNEDLNNDLDNDLNNHFDADLNNFLDDDFNDDLNDDRDDNLDNEHDDDDPVDSASQCLEKSRERAEKTGQWVNEIRWRSRPL